MSGQGNVFCVFIVESPNQSEYSSGIGEAKYIKRACQTAGIPADGHIVQGERDLHIALSTSLSEFVEKQQRMPVLHISCHGNKQGIALMDGSYLHWAQVAKYIRAINRRLSENLLLSVSACEGLHGAHQLITLAAAKAIVAPERKPNWSQTERAFARLYQELAAGEKLCKAVKLMNDIATDGGDPMFYALTDAHEFRLQRASDDQLALSFAEKLSDEDLRHELNDPHFFTSPLQCYRPESIE